MSTAAVTKGDISSELSTSGSVESELTKYYFAPVTAIAEKVNVLAGDLVEAGQSLVSFNSSDLEQEEEKTELQRTASSAEYQGSLANNVKNQVKLTDASNNIANVEPMITFQKQHIKDLQANLNSSESKEKVRLYSSQYSINQQMSNIQYQIEFGTNTVSELASLNLQYHNLNLSLQNINSQLSMLDLDGGFTASEKEIVEQQNVLTDLQTFLTEQQTIKNTAEPGVLTSYAKTQLQANDQLSALLLEQAKENLEKAQSGITADFKGVVTAIGVVEGTPVATGTQLLTLASNTDVKVVISVSKYDLENLEVGQSAAVTINGKDYEGTVSRISHIAVKNSAGAAMVTAEIHINNPDDSIYLGIEAKVKVETASKSQVLMVPVEAVNTDTTGNFVYVVENGIVVRKDVTTGISSTSFIEITGGLEEGEDVITTISTDLAEGAAVAVIPTEK